MLKKHLYLMCFCIACAIAMYAGVILTYEPAEPTLRASLTQPSHIEEAPPPFGGTSAVAACLIDANSGEILYSHNASSRLPMASTTKIMTALCALDILSPSQTITVPKAACGIEGTSIYLCEGEIITVESLLYGLLLNSGNDAASALAIAAGKSIENFSELMNEKAHSLGLIDTNFTNPHGLHDENHYTTAYELCVIASKTLQDPTLSKIMSTKTHTAKVDGLSATRYFSNHNRLLSTYEGCIGVKTGFTKKAGRCLVTAAQRDGNTYIAVTLNDGNDWLDHKNMLDYAFAYYNSVEIAKQDSFVFYHKGKTYANKDSIYLTTAKGQKKPELSYSVCAQKNSVYVNYFVNGNKAGRFDLYCKD